MLLELIKVLVLWFAFFLGFVVGIVFGTLGLLALLYGFNKLHGLRLDNLSKIPSEE